MSQESSTSPVLIADNRAVTFSDGETPVTFSRDAQTAMVTLFTTGPTALTFTESMFRTIYHLMVATDGDAA
jgi:hypothetical protein